MDHNTENMNSVAWFLCAKWKSLIPDFAQENHTYKISHSAHVSDNMDTELSHPDRGSRYCCIDWMQMVVKFICEFTQMPKLQSRFTENEFFGVGSFVLNNVHF